MDSTRYRIELNGAVQGVGFRPFVFRLASTLALNGYVQNSTDGLVIEVEGAADRVAQFIDRLAYERPRTALVTREDVSPLPPTGASGFTITSSTVQDRPRTGMLNDLATCADCLRETLDPDDRRYGYPFTNCIACGPRFTITQRLPYDPRVHDDAPVRDVRRVPRGVRHAVEPPLSRPAERLRRMRARRVDAHRGGRRHAARRIDRRVKGDRRLPSAL